MVGPAPDPAFHVDIRLGKNYRRENPPHHSKGEEKSFMDPNQNVSPRARMKTLLAIPDRDRTDAEWDELIELEIMLAPENRKENPQKKSGQNGSQGQAPKE